MNVEQREALVPRVAAASCRMSDSVSPVRPSCPGFCCVHFRSFECLLFIVTLFVSAAKQISPQGAIKLELNYTELRWNKRHSTAGSLATASWCKEEELEEYAHTINPKRTQTKVPQILNFPPAFVSAFYFFGDIFEKESKFQTPFKRAKCCSGVRLTGGPSQC